MGSSSCQWLVSYYELIRALPPGSRAPRREWCLSTCVVSHAAGKVSARLDLISAVAFYSLLTTSCIKKLPLSPPFLPQWRARYSALFLKRLSINIFWGNFACLAVKGLHMALHPLLLSICIFVCFLIKSRCWMFECQGLTPTPFGWGVALSIHMAAFTLDLPPRVSH